MPEAANSVIDVRWAAMQLGLDLIDYVLVRKLARLNHRNDDSPASAFCGQHAEAWGPRCL
jgi:hypothetical protein